MVIGIIAGGTWLSVTIFVLALCRAAGDGADAVMVPVLVEWDGARPSARARMPSKGRAPARSVRRAPAATASREAGTRVLLFPR
jgi:hypothetical protein